MAAILSQLPNLNSIAGVSLIGGITAVGYLRLVGLCLWPKVESQLCQRDKSDIGETFQVLNALGIIAFAFTVHNLTLLTFGEIITFVCYEIHL